MSEMTPHERVCRRHGTGWQTIDEIMFLDGMGLWQEPGTNERSKPRLTRHELLTGYLAALELRGTWGKLNEGEIRAHVEKLLNGADDGQA